MTSERHFVLLSSALSLDHALPGFRLGSLMQTVPVSRDLSSCEFRS